MLRRTDNADRLAIVTSIAKGHDALALKALHSGVVSPQFRCEILVEFLLERGSDGAKLVFDILPTIHLARHEAQHLFLAAAESGAARVIKLLLQEQMYVPDPKFLRAAFRAAVRGGHTRVMRMLAHTPHIPVKIKVAAVAPSIFRALDGSTRDGSPRSEMGILETQIYKQAREESAERHSRQARMPSRKEIQKREIFERYERLIADSERAIRSRRGESRGHTKQPYSSVMTEMVVDLCTRELLRQRERALFELNRPKQQPDTITLGSGTAADRSTNPPGLSARRSVGEVVEAVFAKYQEYPGSKAASWGALIEAIRKEWGVPRKPLARQALSDLIRERHPAGNTITKEELFLWHQRQNRKPYRQSVAILCQAFSLSPAHELMMWRIARGAAPQPFERLLKRYASAIQVVSTPKERAKLTNALLAFSGIPTARVRELLHVRQLPMWKLGARIEALSMCKKFVELTNPQVLMTERQRRAYGGINEVLVGILTSRPMSVMEAITRAQASPHSSGTCLLLLTGRYGLMQISTRELARHLQVPESTIARMRSERVHRGGHIIEVQAHLIADLVQGVTPQVRGALTAVERCERELMIDTLTGVRSPVALWHQFLSGELKRLGDVVRLTRHRRGDLQLRETSDFELGKALVGIRLANRMADYLGFVGDPYRRVRRDFIVSSMGFKNTTKPEDVLDLIISGRESRRDGLRLMLDLSGQSKAQLAQAIGIATHAVFSWLKTERAGQIAPYQLIRAVSRELGLEHRQEEMYAVFASRVYRPARTSTNDGQLETRDS